MTMFAVKILQATEGLNQPWQSYDLRHELTEKRIRKFAEDYRKTVATL